MKGPGTIECFFGSQNISQELLYQVVCCSTDEQPGALVHFYTDTGGKILRLPASENKILIGDDISKRDLRLERVEMSSQFRFLRRAIFIRIFANSVCIKRTHRFPVYSFGKIYLIEKKEASGIKNILPLIKTSYRFSVQNK